MRRRYISTQKISTLFDALDEHEIARWFSDSQAFMAVPVSYYNILGIEDLLHLFWNCNLAKKKWFAIE
jgi:hypothetical protein